MGKSHVTAPPVALGQFPPTRLLRTAAPPPAGGATSTSAVRRDLRRRSKLLGQFLTVARAHAGRTLKPSQQGISHPSAISDAYNTCRLQEVRSSGVQVFPARRDGCNVAHPRRRRSRSSRNLFRALDVMSDISRSSSAAAIFSLRCRSRLMLKVTFRLSIALSADVL